MRLPDGFQSIGCAAAAAVALWLQPASAQSGHWVSLKHKDGQLYADLQPVGGQSPLAIIGITSGRRSRSVGLDRDEMRQFIYAWEWAKRGRGHNRTRRLVGRIRLPEIDSIDLISVSTGPDIEITISTADGATASGEPTVSYDLAPLEVPRFDAAVATLGSRLSLMKSARRP
jgi:hypothetical protein